MVLTTRKDLPAENLREFIEYVKQNSAKLQFGSAGAGTTTHLGCALLNSAIGANVTHVPYRGGGPAANDLIGGTDRLPVLKHRQRGAADHEQTGKSYRNAFAQSFTADARLGHRGRAGACRL